MTTPAPRKYDPDKVNAAIAQHIRDAEIQEAIAEKLRDLSDEAEREALRRRNQAEACERLLAQDQGECTGDDQCIGPVHVHGCYADLNGPCDSPAEHELANIKTGASE